MTTTHDVGPANRARQAKVLDRLVRRDDGAVVTRRRLVDDLKTEGAIVYRRNGERRFGDTKRTYWYVASDLTQTALDYAASDQCCEPVMLGDAWDSRTQAFTPMRLRHVCE